MKYIRFARNLPLILRVNRVGILKWWTYGSFTVHPNMIVHTGGGI